MNSSKLNIVIAAYNEEAFIFEVIESIIYETQKLNQAFKIIIIDDCSTDNTSSEINKAIKKHDKIEFIVEKNKINTGKGFSLRRGFTHCSDGIIIIQDADLEYSPSEYKKIIDPILNNKADVVYGSRFQGSEPKRVLYYTHYLANRFLTTISNIFTGLNLTDIETCYKAFTTEILKNIKLKENRFGIEPEITAKLSRVKDVRFVEVGISYFGRTYKEGKKIKFKDAIRTLYCIFKYNIWSRK